MDIPLSEEDDLSVDTFDGYIDGESEDEDGGGECCDDGDGNDMVMGMTVTIVLMEALRFWSIFGIQVARKTWQTNRLLPTIVTAAMLEAAVEQTNLFA